MRDDAGPNASQAATRRSLPGRMWDLLKRDWLPLLGFALVTLAATYPLILYMGDSWLFKLGDDMKLKLWDTWRMQRMVATGAPLFHTNAIFYPNGIDLTFHSNSHTTSLAIRLLATVMNELTANKVVVLLGLLTTAYAAYLLIVDLVGRRTAAWLGGAIYAFAPYHMSHVYLHPDLTQLAPLPLAALFLIRTLTTASIPAAVATGVMVGLAGWTSLYILLFTSMTLAPLGIYYLIENGRWKERRTWLAIGVAALVSAAAIAPRLGPAVLDPDILSGAIDAKITTEIQVDPAAYLIPIHHPLLAPLFGDIVMQFHGRTRMKPPYVGIVALTLVVVALLRYRPASHARLWAGITLMFAFLSFGPHLEFLGKEHLNIVLPTRYLYGIGLIEAIRPHLWDIAFLLGLAVLASLGLASLLDAAQTRWARAALTVVPIALLLFEYWPGPTDVRRLKPSPAMEWLAAEQGNFAIINLPISYDLGKKYLLEQTQHGHPMADGMIARMPADAYDYIDANVLLEAWHLGVGCLDVRPGSFEQAVDGLLSDGFRYVVLHRDHANGNGTLKEYEGYFETIEPVYADDKFQIYRVADLPGAVCPYAVSELSAEQAAPTLAIADESGAHACGAFDLRGHGWKVVNIAHFPDCLAAIEQPPNELVLQCLNGEGAWEAAAVSDFDVDAPDGLASFTSHQDGTCGFFVPAQPR